MVRQTTRPRRCDSRRVLTGVKTCPEMERDFIGFGEKEFGDSLEWLQTRVFRESRQVVRSDYINVSRIRTAKSASVTRMCCR